MRRERKRMRDLEKALEDAVRVLRDSPKPAGTCECGRSAGAGERWEVRDIRHLMTSEELAVVSALDAVLSHRG